MSDTTLNRFLSSGTAAQRAAFVPNQQAPASGPNPSAVWLETDTGDTYMWNWGALTWVKIDIGAGGGSPYKGLFAVNAKNATAFASGNWGGCSILLDEACTLNTVKFWAAAASASTTVQAAIYSAVAGVPTTLIASSGVITGVTAGLNSLTLTVPLVCTLGEMIWVGVVVEVASFQAGNGVGANKAFFTTAGPAPASAGAATYGSNPEISMWASK